MYERWSDLYESTHQRHICIYTYEPPKDELVDRLDAGHLLRQVCLVDADLIEEHVAFPCEVVAEEEDECKGSGAEDLEEWRSGSRRSGGFRIRHET